MTNPILVETNNADQILIDAVTDQDVTVVAGVNWEPSKEAIVESSSAINTRIYVEGSVAAVGYGALYLEGNQTSVTVKAGGLIASDDVALTFKGTNQSLSNAGTIKATGAAAAIAILSDNFRFDNSSDVQGTILTPANNVTLNFTASSRTADIVFSFEGDGAKAQLVNAGMIGANDAGLSLTGSDKNCQITIDNSGKIEGNVALSGGNDIYSAHAGSTQGTVSGAKGDDTYNLWTDVKVIEKVGEGTDTINAYLTTSLVSASLTGQDIENLTLKGTGNFNATGNGLKNVLTGNAGNNVLDGGAEADKMVGGDGNDTFVVDNAGDTIVEGNGAKSGIDTVQAKIDYVLANGSNLENLTLTGSAKNGTGNTGDNKITGNDADNILKGGDGKDWLIGGKGVDTLDGGARDDKLDGGIGADKMTGGAGNDVYYADNAKDTVTEGKGAGSDTVHSTVTFTLGANVEKLILDGSHDINGKGNALGNTLTGNGHKNTLWGYDNNDTLHGKGGADTLNGGKGNDKLFGDAGADKLIGGADKDDLTGGAGADILTGGIGNDTFHFAKGLGKDTITDFVANKHDKIDVSTITAIKNFADIQHMMHQVKEDLVIKITKDDWITLENHHKGDFHAGDFMI